MADQATVAVEANNFLRSQCAILEQIAAGAPLADLLDAVVRLVEDQADGMRCSLMLYDPLRSTLQASAAPTLPSDYLAAIDGITIGPQVGTCGTAAYFRKVVVTEDIATDPNWAPFSSMALQHGLRACWSTPVFSSDGELLATFAMYYDTPRIPTSSEIGWVEVAVHLASVALTRLRTLEALREREERLSLLHDLGEALATASKPEEILPAALQVVGERLGVTRCTYAELHEDLDRCVIPYDYAPGAPSIAGEHRLSSFGAGVAARLCAGETLVVEDVEQELEPQEVAPYRAFQVRAMVCHPLIREGRCRAIAAVHQDEARRWKPGEVTVVREFAERCWATMQQKAAETRLLASESKLRSAVQMARLSAFTMSLPDQRIVWSEAPCALPELSEGSAATLDQLCSLCVPGSQDSVRASLEACASEGRSFDLEVQLALSTARVGWVRLLGNPERGGQGHIVRVSGVCQDISEHRRLEEQFRQSQKMEAVGLLAGGVAHDFNNLLTVILTYCQFMGEELRPGDPLLPEVQEIQRAGERAADLTRQLLAFSRKQVLQLRPTALRHSVLSMERMLRRVLGADVELNLLLGEQGGAVLADPGQIEQVLLNLVVNARDAMPQGGTLTVEIASVRLSEEYTRLHRDVAPGDYVMLAVSDTGVGMDEATRARIFEPFFTTKAPGRGTGLGLSTVFGIVSQLGGHLWVYSEPGSGSTFKLYFPRLNQPAEELCQDEAELDGRGIETILVVDDDDSVRSAISTVLSRNGYNVLQAQNGGEAFLTCEKFPARIHLMVSDVVMPRMTGRELAERLETMRPDMKVLFMSGYTEDAIVRHGILNSGIEFLAKPVLPRSLLRKVRRVLDAPRPTRAERAALPARPSAHPD